MAMQAGWQAYFLFGLTGTLQTHCNLGKLSLKFQSTAYLMDCFQKFATNLKKSFF